MKPHHERLEILFQAKGSSLRTRPRRFWLGLAQNLRANITSIKSAHEIDCYVLDDITLLVSDHRVVLHLESQAPNKKRLSQLTTFVILFLRHLPRMAVDKLTLQIGLQGPRSSAALDGRLRQQVSALRRQLGERLGAVVVAGDVAVFYGTSSATHAMTEHLAESPQVCLRAELEGLSRASERALLSLRQAKPGSPLDSLVLNSCLRDFSERGRFALSSTYVLVGLARGPSKDEFCRLRVSLRGRLTIGFEYVGPSESDAVEVFEKVVAELSPASFKIDAIHSGESCLRFSKFWQHQSLGTRLRHSTFEAQNWNQSLVTMPVQAPVKLSRVRESA